MSDDTTPDDATPDDMTDAGPTEPAGPGSTTAPPPPPPAPEPEPTPPPAAAVAMPTPARRTGRPVLGAIAGFFLGLFLWLDLVLFGAIGFESVTFWIFPVVGLIAGIALAKWAPLGRSRA